MISPSSPCVCARARVCLCMRGGSTIASWSPCQHAFGGVVTIERVCREGCGLSVSYTHTHTGKGRGVRSASDAAGERSHFCARRLYARVGAGTGRNTGDGIGRWGQEGQCCSVSCSVTDRVCGDVAHARTYRYTHTHTCHHMVPRGPCNHGGTCVHSTTYVAALHHSPTPPAGKPHDSQEPRTHTTLIKNKTGAPDHR